MSELDSLHVFSLLRVAGVLKHPGLPLLVHFCHLAHQCSYVMGLRGETVRDIWVAESPGSSLSFGGWCQSAHCSWGLGGEAAWRWKCEVSFNPELLEAGCRVRVGDRQMGVGWGEGEATPPPNHLLPPQSSLTCPRI